MGECCRHSSVIAWLWRGSFLPVCHQMTKTKALCFPESEQEEGQQLEQPQSSTHFNLASG